MPRFAEQLCLMLKGEVIMSRLVLIGARRSGKCGDGMLEDVGHRCDDINTSTVGEYAMK